MRTIFVAAISIPLMLLLGTLVIIAAFIGVRDRKGGFYDWARRFWTNTILFTTGVRLTLKHAERMQHADARIYVCNHVSWFDVFCLAAVLPHCKFVGKAEVFRIPVFGAAARAMGMIPIQRDNRKAAVQSIDMAALRVQRGASVVVFPEGTRGASYALRPFKKGPFVLAAAAQAPIVPTVIYGSMQVHARGTWRMYSGDVELEFLEPIDTRGMTYDDRDRLSLECWTRMATTLREEYGIDSGPAPAAPALAGTQPLDT